MRSDFSFSMLGFEFSFEMYRSGSRRLLGYGSGKWFFRYRELGKNVVNNFKYIQLWKHSIQDGHSYLPYNSCFQKMSCLKEHINWHHDANDHFTLFCFFSSHSSFFFLQSIDRHSGLLNFSDVQRGTTDPVTCALCSL